MKLTDIKTIVLSAVCFCLPIVAQGQSARWAIEPKYESIMPFAEGLYKANTYNSQSIFRSNGKEIIEADSITFLTNGYALALVQDGGKYLVASIIDKKGNIVDVRVQVYAGDYTFFSEDKCAVCTKKGRYGYINPSGNLVIDCIYSSARPFREGVASVGKPKKGFKGFVDNLNKAMNKNTTVVAGPSAYIDANGVELPLSAEVGTPVIASSFYGGQAYVQSDNGREFFINKSGQVTKESPEVTFEFDDYFVLNSSKGLRNKADQPYFPVYNTAYQVFSDNGKKGYMVNGSVMLPAQFDQALPFASGSAIASRDGKFGLLAYIGGSPSCKVNDKGSKLSVSATIPADWDDHDAQFVRIVNNAERLSFPLSGTRSFRTLEVDVPATGGARTYEIQIGDLTLWRSTDVRYNTGSGSDTDNSRSTAGRGSRGGGGGIAVSAPSTVKANSKGVCTIPVKVTNRSGQSTSVTVTASTGGSKTVTVAAGKSASVSITTKTVKKTRCTISAKSSAGSGSCATTLEPAFVL